MADAEVSSLPQGWELARIDQKFTSTTKPKALRIGERGAIPFVPMERLPSDRLTFSDFVLRTPQEIASGTYFEDGDLLLSKITPCFENGKQGIATNIPGGWGIASTEIIPINTLAALSHLPFLAMYLLHPDVRRRLASRMEGATGRQRLPKSVLEQCTMPFPPLPEQQAIATVLSKIQSAVAVQDKIVSTLKKLKTATMAKLFREGLRGEPLKQTEIGEIPESWEVVRLGDYCVISSGGTPARDHPEYWNGDIPWVKTAEIDYRPIMKTQEHITEAGLKNSSAKRFPKGTLLMAMYGQGITRGKVAFLGIEATTNQACAALFPEEELDPGYLYAFCAFAYDRIRELGHGANQKNLSADIIREILLTLPARADEQQAIYRAVRAVESRIQAAEERRNSIKKVFSCMLQLLMTGQVRVQVALAEGEVATGRGRVDRRDPVVPETLPREVERFVAELVRRFEPEQVILFGRHAEGSPRAEGEMRLLVVMDFEGRALAEAVRIEREIERDFSLTVIARRPEEVRRALEIGNPLIEGIVERGTVLYARPEAEAKAPVARAREEGRRAAPKGKLGDETLREIVRRVVAAVAPEKIILFGSAAREEMGPDSDVDLLVVKSGVDRLETARAVRRCLLGIGIPKDVIAVTPEDLSRYGSDRSRVIFSALREGKVVYAA
ncbi:MAG: restriction endonuclease subunit S [Actinomycetota bacterium]